MKQSQHKNTQDATPLFKMQARVSMQKHAKVLNVWKVFKNSDASSVDHMADAASVGKFTVAEMPKGFRTNPPLKKACSRQTDFTRNDACDTADFSQSETNSLNRRIRFHSIQHVQPTFILFRGRKLFRREQPQADFKRLAVVRQLINPRVPVAHIPGLDRSSDR